jgi:hypothetical protein
LYDCSLYAIVRFGVYMVKTMLLYYFLYSPSVHGARVKQPSSVTSLPQSIVRMIHSEIGHSPRRHCIPAPTVQKRENVLFIAIPTPD